MIAVSVLYVIPLFLGAFSVPTLLCVSNVLCIAIISIRLAILVLPVLFILIVFTVIRLDASLVSLTIMLMEGSAIGVMLIAVHVVIIAQIASLVV